MVEFVMVRVAIEFAMKKKINLISITCSTVK